MLMVASRKVMALVLWSLGAIWLLLLSGCGERVSSTDAPAVTEALTTPAPESYQPPKPKFSFEDGVDYGYSAEIGQDEERNGIKAKPLVMFRYLGRKDDTYQVVLVEGDVRNVFEVKSPFEFAVVHTFYRNRYQSKSIMPLVVGTVAAAAVSDAIMGHMKQATGMLGGKEVTWWVDSNKKKLTMAPIETSDVKP
jgi:hypothetical protein